MYNDVFAVVGIGMILLHLRTHVRIYIGTLFQFGWIDLEIFWYSSPCLCIEVVKGASFGLSMLFIMR